MKATLPTIIPSTHLAAIGKTLTPALLDASFYLPTTGMDANARFAKQRLPNAQRFDIDHIAATGTMLPHMFPDAATFTQTIKALGITANHSVITYQQADASGAARAWWMFRAFGFPDEQVHVLDAGWEAQSSSLALPTTDDNSNHQPFIASEPVALIADQQAVLAAIQHNQALNQSTSRIVIDPARIQILDARSAERFAGSAPEPRPGLRAGHMPTAINLPFQLCFDTQGRWLSTEALRRLFAHHDIDPQQPTIATCGSGVTACILALALYQLGNTTVQVYDGSWSEWGADSDLPVATAAG